MAGAALPQIQEQLPESGRMGCPRCGMGRAKDTVGGSQCSQRDFRGAPMLASAHGLHAHWHSIARHVQQLTGKREHAVLHRECMCARAGRPEQARVKKGRVRLATDGGMRGQQGLSLCDKVRPRQVRAHGEL